MADFIHLTCPSCGGKLQITSEIDRFACGYCGNEQIVRRSGGIVTLAPVVEGLRQVKVGVDKTAAELAIPRLERELTSLKAQQAAELSRSNGWSFVLYFVAVIPLGSGCLGVTMGTRNMALTIIAIIVGLALFVVGFLINEKTNREGKQKANKFDHVIAVKEKELAENREIVSIYK